MRYRRGAVVALPLDVLRSVLELPAGYEVHHLFLDDYRETVCVAVTCDALPEVPEGVRLPSLPVSDWALLVDTEPIASSLRALHVPTEGGLLCAHCEDYEWPCPTMKVVEAEVLARPLVWRRIQIEINSAPQGEAVSA